MDQKTFEAICRELGQCVKHADAATADRRKQLEESETQPIVIKQLRAKPGLCADCGKYQPDRVSQTHVLKPSGWKSWCNMCKLTRQPGTDYFGLRPKKPEEIKPNRLGPREELLPQPKQPQHPEPLSTTTEISPTSGSELDFVEQVVVREYHESVITEFVRKPVIALPEQDDVQEPDNAVRTG